MRTKSFDELMSGYTSAVQGSASGLIDFTTGSILRACGEGIAHVALWLQGLMLRVLANSRASTATGAALDTWMADFGVTRLGMALANGNVTFTRFTTSGTVSIPVGALVSTADNSLQFAVRADGTNPAYDAGSLSYIMTPGVGSVTVKARATSGGSAGNAAIGQVNTIASPLAGVDRVTNAAPFAGGVDVESDAALRTRFVLYLQSLATANVAAVSKAIADHSAVTDYSITENQLPNGTTQAGNFYAVIDDGTGNPPNSLVTAVTASIELVRPIGTTFSVEKPTVVTVPAGMTVTVASGYNTTATKALVHDTLVAFIDGLTLGQTLPYSRLTQVAYDASPGVINVTSVTLNGGTSDITATAKQVIRAGTVTVS